MSEEVLVAHGVTPELLVIWAIQIGICALPGLALAFCVWNVIKPYWLRYVVAMLLIIASIVPNQFAAMS